MAIRFLAGLIGVVLPFVSLKAEEFNPLTPQNFYLKPFSFDNQTPAPDIDDLLRNNFPKNCPLQEIDNNGADYIIAIDLIDIKAEPMPNNYELIEASLAISLTYTLTGTTIVEKSFKSSVMKPQDNEQEFIYHLTKEMIETTSKSIFNIICLEKD